MSRTLLTVGLVILAGASSAQENSKNNPAATPAVAPSRTDEAQGPEAAARPSDEGSRPRRALRVLQNPYDLASFYRSGGSAPGGWAGLTEDPAYAIAGFYRGQDGSATRAGGWSQFWTNGYSARRPVPFAPYRRTIGQNGDLFLMVPFLAPVAPISGAFSGY